MTVVHIVLFEFKPNTTHAQVEEICNRMTSLASQCVHPKTGKPYITSRGGGRDNSPEGHQGGFSHGFVCEFQTKEDRDYYLNQDPAHLAFVEDVGKVVQNVRVVDYEPGSF